MRTLRRTLTFILALALVAGACSSGSGAQVATVGDSVITERDLGDLYDTDSLTIDAGVRTTLFGLIAKIVLTDALQVEFGEVIDQAELDGVHQAMVDQMEAEGLQPAEYLGVPNAGLAMLRHNAEVAVLREAVQRNLTSDPSFATAILADPAAITTVCVSHILVNTIEDAQAALDRLDDGEDFGALADEISTDSSPQGDLGCRLANRYVAEFARATLDAPVGEPVGPSQSQFGYHILLVRERTAATAEEVAANPREYMAPADVNDLWTAWLTERLQDAVVELDPKYGSWTAFGILPPSE
jgi:parvulin-like peptidyl-prolyl isomerase